MAGNRLKVPKNGLFGLNTDENDISDEIKNKITNNDSTIDSTKNDTNTSSNNDDNVESNSNDSNISDIEVKINGKVVNDNSDNTDNKDKPINDTNNKDMIKDSNDNNPAPNNDNEGNNKPNDNTNPTNESKTNDSDDIINGIVLPNQESYLSTRKQRAYYVKNDNLKKMESIVKKYGLDRSDMVNQSLEMFFKALERLEKNKKEK